MTTATEFLNAGITGQTYREIREKFGKSYNNLAEDDQVDANYAIAFAWFREREHLTVPDAFNKAMTCTIENITALFEETTPEVAAVVDFASPPPTTMP